MDLMQSPLGDEVRKVINAGQGKSNFFIEATIHTLSGDVPAQRVLNHDVIREYSLQYRSEEHTSELSHWE